MLKLGALRLHWSLLLGALLFCAPGFRPALLLAYAAVLLTHVCGHVLASLPAGASLLTLHGLGGEIDLAGRPTPLRKSVVALAGPLAQSALLLGALLAHPHSEAGRELADAFVKRNLIMLLLNLLPIRPLDGADAWRLPGRLRAALRQRSAEPRELPVTREVRREVRDLIQRIRGSAGKVR